MINFGRTSTNQFALWWRNVDKLLFFLIISLMLLGVFFAYTSTSSIASEKIYKTDYLLIAKHILFAFFSFLILTNCLIMINNISRKTMGSMMQNIQMFSSS